MKILIFICTLLSISMISYAEEVPNYLKKQIARTNDSLPQMVDKHTRLDSIKILNDKKLLTTYTIISITNEDFENSAIGKSQKLVKGAIVNKLKTAPTGSEVDAFKKLNYIMSYKFFDKRGRIFYSFDVLPSDYLGSSNINDTFPSNIQEQIKSMNKNLPEMIDELTRMDSIKLLADKKIQLISSFPTLSRKDIEKLNIHPTMEDAKNAIKNDYINMIKSKENGNEMEFFRILNYTVFYKFLDKDGKTLFTFEITPEEYK